MLELAAKILLRVIRRTGRLCPIHKAIHRLSTIAPTHFRAADVDFTGTDRLIGHLKDVFQILRDEKHGTPAASVAGVYFYVVPTDCASRFRADSPNPLKRLVRSRSAHGRWSSPTRAVSGRPRQLQGAWREPG